MTISTSTANLIDHGCGIRTVQVGPIQITRTIATQLERLDLWTTGIGAEWSFPAIARVKTGTTVARDRIKPEFRHYPKHLLESSNYESYDATPRVEVIGCDEGELAIFQVAYGDTTAAELELMGYEVEEHKVIRDIIASWSTLPLAVLP